MAHPTPTGHRRLQTVPCVLALAMALALLHAGCTRKTPPGALENHEFESMTLADALGAARRPGSWEMVVSTPEGQEVGRQLARYKSGKPERVILSEGDLRIYLLYDIDYQVNYKPSDRSYSGAPVISYDSLGIVPPADAGLYEPASPILGVEVIQGEECWIVDAVIGRRNPPVILAIEKQSGLVRELATINGKLIVTTQRVNRVGEADFELPSGVEIPSFP